MIEVQKKENESNFSLLRRFSKRIQQSNILKRAKKIRFKERPLSDFKKKKKALRRIELIKETERLRKLGKVLCL